MLLNLSILDWTIVAAFFAITLGIGLSAARLAGKSLADYFVGGRAMPWWLLGFSMVATTFSTDESGSTRSRCPPFLRSTMTIRARRSSGFTTEAATRPFSVSAKSVLIFRTRDFAVLQWSLNACIRSFSM